jgi:hypothetical protein
MVEFKKKKKLFLHDQTVYIYTVDCETAKGKNVKVNDRMFHLWSDFNPKVIHMFWQINLNKVVATFEKHIFLSQTDLTRTVIISNSYNEMFKA